MIKMLCKLYQHSPKPVVVDDGSGKTKVEVELGFRRQGIVEYLT
jgi:hypothetical protein